MFLSQTTNDIMQINITAEWVDIALLLVTIVSVICAFLAYGHQRKRGRKESACGLAQSYGKSLKCLAEIDSVFDISGYRDIVGSTVAADDSETLTIVVMLDVLPEGTTASDISFTITAKPAA